MQMGTSCRTHANSNSDSHEGLREMKGNGDLKGRAAELGTRENRDESQSTAYRGVSTPLNARSATTSVSIPFACYSPLLTHLITQTWSLAPPHAAYQLFAHQHAVNTAQSTAHEFAPRPDTQPTPKHAAHGTHGPPTCPDPQPGPGRPLGEHREYIRQGTSQRRRRHLRMRAGERGDTGMRDRTRDGKGQRQVD